MALRRIGDLKQYYPGTRGKLYVLNCTRLISRLTLLSKIPLSFAFLSPLVRAGPSETDAGQFWMRS
jgi:hypothetical protein